MPVISYANWIAATGNPHQLWPHVKAGATVPGGYRLASEWLTTGYPAAGTAPGAPVVPTSTTVGAIGQLSPSSGTHLFGYVKRLRTAFAGGVNNGMIVVDRLSHMGGLSGVVTGAQSVNTAALTRYTSGVGVWAAYELLATIGATQTTATASYTNTASVSGQTTQVVNIGGASQDTVRMIQPLPVAVGDLGVLSVQSLSLLATTGTAGNIGIDLFMTLAVVPMFSLSSYACRGGGIEDGSVWFPVQPSACIQILSIGTASLNQDAACEIGFVEVSDN